MTEKEPQNTCTSSLNNLLGCLSLLALCKGLDSGTSRRLLEARLRLIIKSLLSSSPQLCREPLAVYEFNKEKLKEILLSYIESLEPTTGSVDKLAETVARLTHDIILRKFHEIGECKLSNKLADLLKNPTIKDNRRFEEHLDVIRELLSIGAISLVIIPRDDTIFASAPSIAPEAKLREIAKHYLEELTELLGKELTAKLLELFREEEEEKEPAVTSARRLDEVLSRIPPGLIIEAEYTGTQIQVIVKDEQLGIKRRIYDWNQLPPALKSVVKEVSGIEISEETTECIRKKIYDMLASMPRKRHIVPFKILLEECSKKA